MADLNVNSRSKAGAPAPAAVKAAAPATGPAMVGDSVRFGAANKAPTPLAVPHRSFWSRLGHGVLFGLAGLSIGGAVGAAALGAASLFGASLGFGPLLGVFLGAGAIGGIAGSIMGYLRNPSRGDYLKDASILKADPNGAQIQALLARAGSKSKHDAAALYDRAAKLATTSRAAGYLAKQAESNNIDPLPYYARATELSQNLGDSLAIAGAVGDYQSNYGGDATTRDVLNQVYTKAAGQATPSQAASFAAEALKQGAYPGSSAAYTKSLSTTKKYDDAMGVYTGITNLIYANQNLSYQDAPPADNPASAILKRALELATTRDQASNVENEAANWHNTELAHQAAARAKQLGG